MHLFLVAYFEKGKSGEGALAVGAVALLQSFCCQLKKEHIGIGAESAWCVSESLRCDRHLTLVGCSELLSLADSLLFEEPLIASDRS